MPHLMHFMATGYKKGPRTKKQRTLRMAAHVDGDDDVDGDCDENAGNGAAAMFAMLSGCCQLCLLFYLSTHSSVRLSLCPFISFPLSWSIFL